MNSPYPSPSSSSTTPKTRTESTFSTHLTETGAIRKRSTSRSSRPRSISAATIERYPDLLPDQLQSHLNLGPVDWNPARHSPQQQGLPISSSNSSASQPYPQPGAIPSRSGNPPLSENHIKDFATSRSPRHSLPTTTTGMASLGYLPTPHYHNMGFQDPSYDPNYQQMDSHSHAHPSNFGFLFGGSSAPAQQSIYASGPLHAAPKYSTAPLGSSISHASEPSLSSFNRAGSPYHPSSYESLDFPLPINRSISHSPLSSHLGPLTPPLSSGLDSVQSHMMDTPATQAGMESVRSPSVYDAHSYSSAYTVDPVQASQPLYATSQSYSYPPSHTTSTRQQVPRSSTDSQVRVLNQKPKPQCWEHGCNGREFSTFSNLLRHQREKSGTAAKSYCPKCGAEFTRTTARNGHLAHEKCSKPRRASEVSSAGAIR